MANTPKIKRQWIKEEKRIVELLYRKGFIKGEWKLDDLYWAEFHWYQRKCYKTKYNSYDGKRYRFPVYMPEIHFMTTDYWGESDEHSIVDSIKQTLWWEHIDTKNWDETSGEYPESTFPNMNRRQFIQYLKKLPTKVGDNKINKILKNTNLYD
jgi:hypothetical protein